MDKATIIKAPEKVFYSEKDLPCIYRAHSIGKLNSIHVFICNALEQTHQPICTIHPVKGQVLKKHNGDEVAVNNRIKNCDTCRLRKTDYRIYQQMPTVETFQPLPKGYIKYTTTEQLTRDTLKLIPLVPADCAGIVGVPRSGMIPASILATNLHLPLLELTDNGPRAMGSGYRGTWIKFKPGKGPFFVVDDSTYCGGAMKRAREKMRKHKAIFAAVYSKTLGCADVHAGDCLLDCHIFEWNIFNNKIVEGGAIDPRLRGGICYDFDGVICEDPTFAHKDSEEDRVIEWLLNAPPKHLVRGVKIPMVISFRLEKHRSYIQQWLDKYQVQVQNLILHPATTFAERDKNFNCIEHKAERFKNSPHCIMFESDSRQAKMIAEYTGKPVIAIDKGLVFE